MAPEKAEDNTLHLQHITPLIFSMCRHMGGYLQHIFCIKPQWHDFPYCQEKETLRNCRMQDLETDTMRQRQVPSEKKRYKESNFLKARYKTSILII